MTRRSSDELVPRNGHTLIVGIGARISGCANQKELSLEDQVDHAKAVAREMYSGKIEFIVIATKGKGERLDRPELEQIEAELRKGCIDLFIFEDLGRLVRGHEAVRLMGIGVDNGTRTIVPNDMLDTADETWEEEALAACSRHVGNNAHTSKRIKQKMMNRFTKTGACPARPIAGYIGPKGVKTYGEWKKQPEWQSTVDEGKRLLKETCNCEAVAEYFNRVGFPVGPYCRKRDKRWDGKMVRRFYSNPLLKGMPSRGARTTKKNYETGRRISKKNPKGPKFFECPHLAFMPAEEFDELNAMLADRNRKLGRKPVNGRDPRANVARKRTAFPGNCSCCLYCGRQQVWGGNGIKDHLMCSGAREWRCWCSIGFDGHLATRNVLNAIVAKAERLKGFDEQFRQLVVDHQHGADGGAADWARLEADEKSLTQKLENISDAISNMGFLPHLAQKQNSLLAEQLQLKARRLQLKRLRDSCLEVPASAEELRQQLLAAIAAPADDQFELANVLRKLVPEFHVYLVRLCDGGHPLPRARVRLALDGLTPDAQLINGLPQLLNSVVTIDLFEPPQRERIREQAVQLSAQGLTSKQIAERIDERPTGTAVCNALLLDEEMRSRGLDTPYVLLDKPPVDYPKMRRHLNPKYRFEPLEGYVPPQL